MGQVTKWQMTEEERQAYIEKYPIKLNEPERKRPKHIKEFRWPSSRKEKAER